MLTQPQYLQHIIEQLGATRSRQLIVLSGSQSWAIDLLFKVLTSGEYLWLGNDGHNSGLAMAKAKLSLGREYRQLIFNAYSGFHPDAFGQAVGALVGGGICFVIAPEWTQWQHFNDPDYQRYVSNNNDTIRVNNYFIQRLQRVITADEKAIVLEEKTSEWPAWQAPLPVLNEDVPAPYATEAQRCCVLQIIKTWTGHRQRPLVINADRGRGKSSALGIAAAQLLANNVSYIIVTAPKFASVQALFSHASDLLPNCEIQKHTLCWQGKRIEFVPPDSLVSQLPSCDLVLVDEAAAIPTPMLTHLAKRYSRLVFATTVHGYEGTGRGFTLRFLPTLITISPNMRHIKLSEPVRWQNHDHLEMLSNQLLGLNFSAVNIDSHDDLAGLDTVEYRAVTQAQLLSNERLFEQLFGLLVLAHYQTSPSDFRQLLDAPDLYIFIATLNGDIVGAALILKEGVIDADLAAEIALGKRRLRGHLLPQSLLSQLGVQGAAALKYARVMRIAIHPQLQHQGLGGALDQYVTRWAKQQSFDILGSSFGATTALSQFWFNQGYSPIRLGLTKDSASGTHSLMVLKPLTSVANEIVRPLHDNLYRSLRYDMADQFKHLDWTLIIALMAQSKRTSMLTDFEYYNIQNFTVGHRPFEQVNYIMERVLWHNPQALLPLSKQHQQLLVGRVLQRQSWSLLSTLLSLTGKKATQQAMKNATEHWFTYFNKFQQRN